MSHKEIHNLIIQLKELPELKPLDRVQERLEEALAYVRGERETETLAAEQPQSEAEFDGLAWAKKFAEFDPPAPAAAAPTDAQDAARYRWLRDKTTERHDFYADVDRWSVAKERGGFGQCYSGDALDAAIDAALKEQQ